MKKQKIIALLIIVVMIIPNGIIFAANAGNTQWADFSKAEIQFVKGIFKKDADGYYEYYGYENEYYYIKIEGVELNEDNDYCIYLNDTKDRPEISNDPYEITANCVVRFSADSMLEDGRISLSEDSMKSVNSIIARAKNEKMYMWIVEVKYVEDDNGNWETYFEEVASEKEIQIPEKENPITKKVYLDFLPESNRIYVHINEPYDNEVERTINVKLGKVDENEIIYDLEEKKISSVEKIMDYARNNEEYIYTKELSVGMNYGITPELKEMELEEESLYYTYIEVKTEEDKYPVIEDVLLYTVENIEKEEINLYLESYPAYSGLALIGLPLDDFEQIKDDELEEPEKPEEEKPTIPETPKPSPVIPSGNVVENVSEKVKDNTIAFIPYPNTGESRLILAIIAVIILIGVLGKLSKEREDWER